jgi:D-lactate dehydrogenase
MADLVELIVDKYDGSLKAEHGTGLNMAPWVEREWGHKAVEMMWRIKALADPDNVLSPGVLLNRDPGVHLRNLKSAPPIEAEADNCVECGFCEPVCPSRHLTTTPRQRIVLRREMARQPAGSPVLRALLDEYEYDALETCAADGSCMLACPLGIDTGKLVKDLRAREHGPRSERIALAAARRWAAVERGARGGLRAGDALRHAIGDAPLRGATRALRAAVSTELVPEWPADMPRPAPAHLPATMLEGAAAVYLPACINRIFGHAPGQDRAMSLPEALVTVSRRAGHPVWVPPDAVGHCCATPWSSKGYRAGNSFMANRTVEALWRWTQEGQLPVVIDASSCALGLRDDVPAQLDEHNAARHERLEIIDSVAWAHDRLLPDLTVTRRVRSVATHPPCSVRHLGLVRQLEAIAAELAEDVVTPPSATCCGFAGDRGFLHPELTAAATADEAAELSGRSFDAYMCSNRTCEIGLQQATGADYTSFLFLLEELTRS